MGQTISFKRPDGQSVQGYLAEPAGGSGPGVVVIQEWWGLNAQIKGVADRMACRQRKGGPPSPGGRSSPSFHLLRAPIGSCSSSPKSPRTVPNGWPSTSSTHRTELDD